MNALRVRLAERAVEDLVSIFLRIAAEAGERAADRWHERLIEAAKTLGTFPERGRVAAEAERVHEDIVIRQIMCGTYRILYKVDADGVLVLHVRHGARAPAADLNLESRGDQ